MFDAIILTVSGLVAGTIDAIAGGGGLITLPVLSQIIEPGAHAIGTNKIAGMVAALTAFLVYARNREWSLKKGLLFVCAVGAGSFLGSLLSPLLPTLYFRFLLVIFCPVVLFVVWNRKLFAFEVAHHTPRALHILILTGVGVGFYDGFFGPGGGTFMLLGLLLAVRLPLFEALLFSKLANTLSAGVSLVSYAYQGYVHPKEGIILATAMMIGSFIGAKITSAKSTKIVRPVLLLVVSILLLFQLKEMLVHFKII